MTEVVLYRVNEEKLELHINGVYIMGANHDVDGWHGMQKFEDTIKVMAQFTGCNYQEIEVGE